MCKRVSAVAASLLSSLLLSAATLPASATSYTTYITSSSNQGNVLNYGLTDGGTVVLETSLGSGPFFSSFTPPSTVQSYGSTAPNFVYDNGSPCSLSLPGIFTGVSQSRCNNGFEVFEASLSNGIGFGLFTGSDPVADLLYPVGNYSFDNLLLNAYGDIAAVGAGAAPDPGDRNLLFIASTPEPSTFALLGSGFLAAAGIFRRRHRVHLPA